MAAELDARWRDWIAENIARGCALEAMVGSMRAAGIDEGLARHSIAEHMPSRPSRLPSLVYPPCQLKVNGRSLKILMTLRKPAITVVEAFLEPRECELIMALSMPKLEPSRVVSNADGVATLDPVRTSYGTYFLRGTVAELRPIEERLAALTGMPVAHGEGLQVLRYGVGARYVPHFDFFPPEVAGSTVHATPMRGGQRVATVVMYLNTVAKGGETEFPEVGCKVSSIQGNACFFSYMDADGRLDRATLHGGNPVEDGEKWIATWWMREGEYAAAG
jgi:prolyl 4-hydroxylase